MLQIETVASHLSALAVNDSLEADHHKSCVALLQEAEARAFDRSNFDPGHFTASAFVLHPTKAALLLIFHGKLQRWLQPGGHLEPSDENIDAACRRELHEETGVDDLEPIGEGLFDVDVHQIPDGRDPAHRHFDLRRLYRAKSAVIVAGSDAHDARWVPLHEVNAYESDASVMRVVTKLAPLATC